MCPHLGAGSVREGRRPEAPAALGKHCLGTRRAAGPLLAWGGGQAAEHYGVAVLDGSLCHTTQDATPRASPQGPGIKAGTQGGCDDSDIALQTFMLGYFIGNFHVAFVWIYRGQKCSYSPERHYGSLT